MIKCIENSDYQMTERGTHVVLPSEMIKGNGVDILIEY